MSSLNELLTLVKAVEADVGAKVDALGKQVADLTAQVAALQAQIANPPAPTGTVLSADDQAAVDATASELTTLDATLKS